MSCGCSVSMQFRGSRLLPSMFQDLRVLLPATVCLDVIGPCSLENWDFWWLGTGCGHLWWFYVCSGPGFFPYQGRVKPRRGCTDGEIAVRQEHSQEWVCPGRSGFASLETAKSPCEGCLSSSQRNRCFPRAWLTILAARAAQQIPRSCNSHGAH